MVLITIIVLLFIFSGSMMLGIRLSKTSRAFLAVGEKILKNKETQLEHSPFFKSVRNYREAASKEKLAFFLFVLIFLKSIVFFFISIVLIAPIVIFFQGLSMGSLFHVMEQRDGQTSKLLRITSWQALGQVTAGGMGTWLGYHWLIGEGSGLDWSWFLTLESWIWLLVIIISGHIAAHIEARMIISEYS